MAAFAPGVTIDDPSMDGPMEGDEIGGWVEALLAGFPDIRFEKHGLYTTDDPGVFVVQWTMHGTHTGTFDGLPPTNHTIGLDGVTIVTAAEDGIESIRIYYDPSSFAEQLGLEFPGIVRQLPTLEIGVRNAL